VHLPELGGGNLFDTADCPIFFKLYLQKMSKTSYSLGFLPFYLCSTKINTPVEEGIYIKTIMFQKSIDIHH